MCHKILSKIKSVFKHKTSENTNQLSINGNDNNVNNIYQYNNCTIYEDSEESNSRSSVPMRFYEEVSERINRSFYTINDAINEEYQNNLSLFDLCIKEKHIILLGDSGSGKSIELSHTAYWASKNDYHTILFQLSDYTGQDIIEIVHQYYSDIPLNSEVFKIFLIFDSFDEIGDEYRDKFISNIRLFSKTHKDIIILISSRRNYYRFADSEGEGATFRNFSEYYLSKLSKSDVNDYLLSKGIDFNEFYHKISDSKLLELIYNPFYLTKIVKILNDIDILPNKTQLMKKIIDASFYHDSDKKDIVDRNEEKIHGLLNELSISMQLSGDRIYISKSNYQKLFNSEERELIECSGLFSKKNNDTWRFEHNNFREYLAAEYLSHLSLQDIKNVICSDAEKKVVSYEWLNVISYLVFIREDTDLNYWLIEDNVDVFIDSECDRIDDEQKYNVFRGIMDKFTKDNVHIRVGRVDVEHLCKVCNTEECIDYLINVLKSFDSEWQLSNAIIVLSSYDKIPYKNQEIKELLVSILNSDDKIIKDYIRANSIDVFNNLQYDAREILPIIMSSLDKNRTSYFVLRTIKYITKNNLIDENIEFLLNEQNNLSYDNEHMTSIRWAIREACENVRTLESIQAILKHFIKNTDYYSDYTEVYNYIVELSIQLYKDGNNVLYDDFKSLYWDFDNYNFTLLKVALSFFKETGTLDCFFNDWFSFDFDDEIGLSKRIHLLLQLNNNTCFDAALQKFEEDPHKYEDFISRLYYNLNVDSVYINKIESSCSLNGVIISKREKSYNELKAEADQLYFDSLFDIDKHIEYIRILSKISDSEKIERDELRIKVYSYYDFKFSLEREIVLNIIHELYSLHIKSILLIEFESIIENHQDFLMLQVANMLTNKDNHVDVSEEQRNAIYSWCNSYIQSCDICNEIHSEGINRLSYSTNIKSFCELSKIFDFKYSDDIFIKLILVPSTIFGEKYNSDNTISDYVSTHLSKEKITSAIKENIEKGNMNYFSIFEHIAFCKINNLDYALNLAEEICYESEYSSVDKRHALEYIVKQKNDSQYSYVYDKFLNTEDENLLRALVELSIESKNPNLCKKLEDYTSKSENKYVFLQQLLSLESRYGLKVYYNLAKEKMKTPDGEDHGYTVYTDVIGDIKSKEALPELIELMNLLFTDGFQDIEYFGLNNALYKAFENISKTDTAVVIDSLKHYSESSNKRLSSFCNTIIMRIENYIRQPSYEAWNLRKIKDFINNNRH